MRLFNLGKKNREPRCVCSVPVESAEEESCCCSSKVAGIETQACSCPDARAGIQSIKVLGAGCKSCHEMYENTKIALKTACAGIEAEYITDMEKVMEYGVMSMPGLVVNEKVVSMGRVLKPAEIEALLNKQGFIE